MFDRELSTKLKAFADKAGSDAKLVTDSGNAGEGEVAMVTLATKLLQVVIAKMANFIPGGGIWLNTQRPEWNDANNALAGYGLSMVTLYYLHRYVKFLISIFESSDAEKFTLPSAVADCFKELGKLYAETSAKKAATNAAARKAFSDAEGKLFEKERNSLYKKGYGTSEKALKKADILAALTSILEHIKTTIALNQREDGLYHAYNTVKITGFDKDGLGGKMEVEYLQEMLEGQVAVLSAEVLKPEEALGVLKALRASRMYEPHQNSYMLYPNKELAMFEAKNCVSASDVKAGGLEALVEKTGSSILYKDCNGKYHFNGEFRNVGFLREFCDKLPANKKPKARELTALEALYENTFNHQSFTGRSGTFYAYEGLGSIYWHMVSKLLLATQENTLAAIKEGASTSLAKELCDAYYEVRSGIGFNKEAEVYGAFPADPYSHTPYLQGAKQPGMTGQVKEEVLTRWGELGVNIENGLAQFKPTILRKSEFFADGTLSFTWCGASIVYKLTNDSSAITVNGKRREGNSLTTEESADLFARNGKIIEVIVEVKL